MLCSPALYCLLLVSTVVHGRPVHVGPRDDMTTEQLAKRAMATYKAVTFAEDKRTVFGVMFGAIIVSAGIGMATIRSLDHHACMFVQRQEEAMQHKWDLNHPDGFVPAGGQLRPATFRCKDQERPFKPLQSYHPSDFY